MASAVTEAERRIVRTLASAHEEDSAQRSHELDRLDSGSLVGIVAPGLSAAKAAAAPAIRPALLHRFLVGSQPGTRRQGYVSFFRWHRQHWRGSDSVNVALDATLAA